MRKVSADRSAVFSRNAEHLREYLSWKRDVQRRAQVTVDDYRSSLLSLHVCARDCPLDELTTPHLETWLHRPRGGRAHDRPGRPATVAKEVALLRDLYRWLQARGYARSDPSVLLVAPRVHNANPRPIKDGVWASLWSDETLTTEERAILGLGAFAGLRRREMCELRLDQVDLDGGRLVAFTRKGGGDDILPYGELLAVFETRLPHLTPGGATSFTEPFQKLVEGRRNESGRYVLSWGERTPASIRQARKHAIGEGMADPQALNRFVGRLVARLGIASPFAPHDLRHSFVSWLLRAGVPLHLVSRLANHSSPAVTMRYTKAGGAELREWMRAQSASRSW